MGFRTLVFTYLLGGLTLLPLVFAAVLASAWYLLPKVDPTKEDEKKTSGGEKAAESDEAVKGEEKSRSRQESTSDTGASGTFAVLRKYDFQTAIQALNARNNASAAGGASGNDGTAGDGSSSSESVYQSMYRSVFTGNKNASNTSILENEDAQQTPSNRRKPVSANVMYIVLRHGHLMLYDSPAQIEVKHVLSLAHHNVSLQSGKDAHDETDDRKIPEADLFIKRTAIVLTPVELPNGAMQNSTSHKPAKPIYLFSATSFEKEDFYHALLSSRSHPPTPLPLDPEALVKLIKSSLHSASLTPETRALNALLGRVFLGIHHTDYLKKFILGKMERKLVRIQKPNFIPMLRIRSLDLGDAAPIFTNLKLRELNISGDTTISADMRYNGGLSITLLAVAKLDLGPRFKTRTVDLVLKATMQRMQGTMLMHIKPPPSNRLWYCFESMPELEVRAEPVVSERKITYGFVLRAIEERVRTALGEGLVKPNWDDVPMPLIDTRGTHVRGGLWSDEGLDEHPELRPGSTPTLADLNEKRLSTQSIPPELDTGASTGLASNSDVNLLKLRHSATMPVDERQFNRRPAGSSHAADLSSSPDANTQSALLSRPLRTPSITMPSPVVAVDGQTVEPVRSDDPSLRPASQNRRLWLPRGSASGQQPQKDALDGLRDLRARAEQAAMKPSTVAAAEGNRSLDDLSGSQDSDEASLRSQQPSDSTIPATPRSFSIRSTDSERSSATSLSSAQGPQSGQRKAAILAAAGAATNAARNWGWNTYQKNKGILPRAGAKQETSPQPTNQPMGRGEPLPPPGQPLPGPNKGIWGGMTSMRRKPVPALPPRRPRPGESDTNQGSPNSRIPVSSRPKSGMSQRTDGEGEDEFGTWQENVVAESSGASGGSSESVNAQPTRTMQQSAHEQSSASMTEEEDLLQLSADDPETPRTKKPDKDDTPSKPTKIPPPLPSRRRELSPREKPDEDKLPTHHANAGSEEKLSKDSEQEDSSDTPALRIPEGAADAIAAENSTVALETDARDDQEHLDEAHAVDAEVRPESSEEPNTQGERAQAAETESLQVQQPTGRRRANTAERFLRGEDLKEEDFEEEANKQANERQQAGDKPIEPSESVLGSTDLPAKTETDEVSERIKAQVQKHTSTTESELQAGSGKGNDEAVQNH